MLAIHCIVCTRGMILWKFVYTACATTTIIKRVIMPSMRGMLHAERMFCAAHHRSVVCGAVHVHYYYTARGHGHRSTLIVFI